jgi:hypothetical protein
VEIKKETSANEIRGDYSDKNMIFNADHFDSSSLGRKTALEKSVSVDSSNLASRKTVKEIQR